MELVGSSLEFTASAPITVTDDTINETFAVVTVTFDSQPCINFEGNTTIFSCSLPTNNDGTPQLSAGSYLPTVYVNPYGYIDFDSNVTAINIPLTLTLATPNNGGSNGGYIITVNGTGFPTNG